MYVSSRVTISSLAARYCFPDLSILLILCWLSVPLRFLLWILNSFSMYSARTPKHAPVRCVPTWAFACSTTCTLPLITYAKREIHVTYAVGVHWPNFSAAQKQLHGSVVGVSFSPRQIQKTANFAIIFLFCSYPINAGIYLLTGMWQGTAKRKGNAIWMFSGSVTDSIPPFQLSRKSAASFIIIFNHRLPCQGNDFGCPHNLDAFSRRVSISSFGGFLKLGGGTRLHYV